MPRRTKKKFIDKKSAVTFHLVHRSQRDPLAADEEAPQRVLVPLDENVIEHDFSDETLQEREERISAQRTYGIGFDDDYDYMQHLREPDRQTAVLIPKDPRLDCEDFFKGNSVTTDSSAMGENYSAIKMPSIVFASKDEEDIGMLHRAIPPVGPQVDWDPDVVAAMDEDFDFEDPDNNLDDDFIVHANAGNNSYESADSDAEDNTDSECSNDCQLSDVDAFFDQFVEEETRSRFTQYSMSSSVLPRNNQLSLLDDQFEKFYEAYDEEKIGDLPHVEIDGVLPVHDISQKEALRMLLGIKEEEDENEKVIVPQQHDSEKFEKNIKESTLSDEDVEENFDDEMVDIVVGHPREKWDCESIISTYSNIYNHPKLIKDMPSKPITLSKKTGIPLDTLPTRGLTAKQLHILDLQNSAETDRIRRTSESSNVTLDLANVRRKDETKEEKAARKHVVKEMRRERRAEKKATKVAFRQEKTRQNKELLNMQLNLKGIKIS